MASVRRTLPLLLLLLLLTLLLLLWNRRGRWLLSLPSKLLQPLLLLLGQPLWPQLRLPLLLPDRLGRRRGVRAAAAAATAAPAAAGVRQRDARRERRRGVAEVGDERLPCWCLRVVVVVSPVVKGGKGRNGE